MSKLALYVVTKQIVEEWQKPFQSEGLILECIRPARKKGEGVEQDWKCSDERGDLFYFCVAELSQKNTFDLPAGTFLLAMGPDLRSNIIPEFRKFERILIALGAERHKY